MSEKLSSLEIAEDLQNQAERGVTRPRFCATHQGHVFRDVQYVCTDWEGDLRDTHWTNVDLRGSSFTDCLLEGAVFEHCQLEGVEFPMGFRLPKKRIIVSGRSRLLAAIMLAGSWCAYSTPIVARPMVEGALAGALFGLAHLLWKKLN